MILSLTENVNIGWLKTVENYSEGKLWDQDIIEAKSAHLIVFLKPKKFLCDYKQCDFRTGAKIQILSLLLLYRDL